MVIGFTGTRKGMTEAQKDQLSLMLAVFVSHANEFHHGDAVGADREAVGLAQQYGFTCVAHPAGADPLVRNREIVAASSVLIAAPETDKEQQRSGTWATCRYARAYQIPVVMLSRGIADYFDVDKGKDEKAIK